MTPDENAIAAGMLKLQSNKKLLQIYMQEKTGKIGINESWANIDITDAELGCSATQQRRKKIRV